jgi:hypothetical protein
MTAAMTQSVLHMSLTDLRFGVCGRKERKEQKNTVEKKLDFFCLSAFIFFTPHPLKDV